MSSWIWHYERTFNTSYHSLNNEQKLSGTLFITALNFIYGYGIDFDFSTKIKTLKQWWTMKHLKGNQFNPLHRLLNIIWFDLNFNSSNHRQKIFIVNRRQYNVEWKISWLVGT